MPKNVQNLAENFQNLNLVFPRELHDGVSMLSLERNCNSFVKNDSICAPLTKWDSVSSTWRTIVWAAKFTKIVEIWPKTFKIWIWFVHVEYTKLFSVLHRAQLRRSNQSWHRFRVKYTIVIVRAHKQFRRQIAIEQLCISQLCTSPIYFQVDKVYLVDRLGTHENLVGTVHVTTTHIIFRAENGTKELWLATGLIASVERGTLTAAGCMLVIRCKHFQVGIQILKCRRRGGFWIRL